MKSEKYRGGEEEEEKWVEEEHQKICLKNVIIKPNTCNLIKIKKKLRL